MSAPGSLLQDRRRTWRCLVCHRRFNAHDIGWFCDLCREAEKGMTGSALVLYDPPGPFPDELLACQNALGDIEIHIYEAWTFETITKDAARHFLVIADICGWDMPWVAEMREWAS